MAVFDELNLDHQEYQHLRTYFANNLSLKATVEALFLHKNTIQYQLNRIWKRTGYNPRIFQDAVVLYILEQNLFRKKMICTLRRTLIAHALFLKSKQRTKEYSLYRNDACTGSIFSIGQEWGKNSGQRWRNFISPEAGCPFG